MLALHPGTLFWLSDPQFPHPANNRDCHTDCEEEYQSKGIETSPAFCFLPSTSGYYLWLKVTPAKHFHSDHGRERSQNPGRHVLPLKSSCQCQCHLFVHSSIHKQTLSACYCQVLRQVPGDQGPTSDRRSLPALTTLCSAALGNAWVKLWLVWLSWMGIFPRSKRLLA